MKIKLSKDLKKCVTEPTILAEILQLLLKQRDETDKMKEIFYVIGLDTRNNIQYIEIVSIGTLTASLVHPRETFRIAIMQNSAHIIIAHNHPSGEVEPSEDDLKITKRLVDAGKIMGIEVLDHLIFSHSNYLSFKEKLLL